MEPEHDAEVRDLLVILLLCVAAQWYVRMLLRVERFPLLISVCCDVGQRPGSGATSKPLLVSAVSHSKLWKLVQNQPRLR